MFPVDEDVFAFDLRYLVEPLTWKALFQIHGIPRTQVNAQGALQIRFKVIN